MKTMLDAASDEPCIRFALVEFSELGREGDPMGRYNGLPVYPSRDVRGSIQQGGSYICSLDQTDKVNCYWARPVKEVDDDYLRSIVCDLSDEFAEHIYHKHSDLVRNDVTLRAEREITERIEKKIRHEYESRIMDLEEQLEEAKARFGHTGGMGSDGAKIVEGMLVSDRIDSRRYSCRVDIRSSTILVLPDDEGDIRPNGGAIPIKNLLELLGGEPRVTYCRGLNGFLISRREDIRGDIPILLEGIRAGRRRPSSRLSGIPDPCRV